MKSLEEKETEMEEIQLPRRDQTAKQRRARKLLYALAVTWSVGQSEGVCVWGVGDSLFKHFSGYKRFRDRQVSRTAGFSATPFTGQPC